MSNHGKYILIGQCTILGPLTDQLHVSITAADDQIRFQSKYTTPVNRVTHHFIHGNGQLGHGPV